MSTSQHAVKGEISKKILSAIKEKGGRFVRPISSDAERRRFGVPEEIRRAWVIVPDSVSLQKIKQALREQDPAQDTSNEFFHQSGTKRKTLSFESPSAAERWRGINDATVRKTETPLYPSYVRQHETLADSSLTFSGSREWPIESSSLQESQRVLSSLGDGDFLTRLRCNANLSQMELRFQQQQALQRAILISQQARSRLDASMYQHGIQPSESRTVIIPQNNAAFFGPILEQQSWQMLSAANQFTQSFNTSSSTYALTQSQTSPEARPTPRMMQDRCDVSQFYSAIQQYHSKPQKSCPESDVSRRGSVEDEDEKKPKSR